MITRSEALKGNVTFRTHDPYNNLSVSTDQEAPPSPWGTHVWFCRLVAILVSNGLWLLRPSLELAGHAYNNLFYFVGYTCMVL